MIIDIAPDRSIMKLVAAYYRDSAVFTIFCSERIFTVLNKKINLAVNKNIQLTERMNMVFVHYAYSVAFRKALTCKIYRIVFPERFYCIIIELHFLYLIQYFPLADCKMKL